MWRSSVIYAALGAVLFGCGSGTITDDPDVISPPICSPSGGGPYWLLEGEQVAFSVACSTGEPLSGSAFTLDDLPAGAVWDPTSRTVTWTPGLDQAAVWEIVVEAAGELGTVTVGVADRWNDPANVPVVDPARYTLEYGLPVFHIYAAGGAGAIDEEPYSAATISYRGHDYTAEIKKRGAASIRYPKNSYTIKFAREDKFDEPVFPTWDGGFHEKRKISLTTTFDDNSYLRTRMAFELWNRLDPGHILVQSFSAVVFFDGEYYGLYEVSDKVDGFLMEDFGLQQDGNLYKAISHDANFRLTSYSGGPKVSLHDGFEKKEGTPVQGQAGAFSDLEELVTWAATSSPAQFAAEIDGKLDRRDYEDWWIFVTLIMADDSMGKNSYHYHDPTSGPWRYVPWDFNHGLGQTWQSARTSFDAPPEYYAYANGLFERLLDAPEFGDALRARYGEALAGVYSTDQVLALFDAMVAEIEDGARRDEVKWGEAYRGYVGWSFRSDFTTYDEEVAYVRQWIADRWAFVDAIY